jgi:tRNA(Ile)-lysidine synthase TilS/MesJ
VDDRPPRPPRAPAYAEPRYAERDYDDGEYRYKEREWVTWKRDDSPSRDGYEREEFREEVIEEVGEREKPFPRRGKTRMPRRLVEIQVLYDLRYPFHEEVRSSISTEFSKLTGAG